MAYRGIADDAIKVIDAQKNREVQMRQLAENARQFDIRTREGARQFDAQLGESARQFDTRTREGGRQFDAQLGENARQFDTQIGENARQFDTKMREGARQFDAGYNLDLFKAEISDALKDAEISAKDADTQMKLLTLKEFVAAAETEQSQRRNRDELAKSAIGSFFSATIMNGGVAPVTAIQLLQKAIGDKDNAVVGGYLDAQSGVGVLQIRDAGGNVTEKRMDAGTMYSLFQSTLGDKAASAFQNFYRGNEVVTAQLEQQKARMAAQTGRNETSANMRKAELYYRFANDLQKEADSLERGKMAFASVQSGTQDPGKLTGPLKEEYERYVAKIGAAQAYRQRAEALLNDGQAPEPASGGAGKSAKTRSPLDVSPSPGLDEETRKAYKIPAAHKIVTLPEGTFVVWSDPETGENRYQRIAGFQGETASAVGAR